MIAFLKGYIEELKPDVVLLDVGGVGYLVEISAQTHNMLKPNSDVKLLIYHHITDNDQRLFGFYTREEKKLFEQLITVKGVGPKSGLNIVSGLQANLLIQAIQNADIASLTRVPGIGKKTAERIALELKDKIGKIATSTTGAKSTGAMGLANEVISALEALGFKRAEAEKTTLKVLQEKDVDTVQVAIKKALSLLKK